MKKLNAGNDDESRMRAKRSIFDSTRLRYSSVFCSVASRVVTNNLYVYINASSRSRRFYVVGRSRRFVGHAASTQKNPTGAHPRGVARTSSHTPHFLFPRSNSLSFCLKAYPVRVRDDVLLVLDVRAASAYSKQRAPRAAHARVHVVASENTTAPFGAGTKSVALVAFTGIGFDTSRAPREGSGTPSSSSATIIEMCLWPGHFCPSRSVCQSWRFALLSPFGEWQ